MYCAHALNGSFAILTIQLVWMGFLFLFLEISLSDISTNEMWKSSHFTTMSDDGDYMTTLFICSYAIIWGFIPCNLRENTNLGGGSACTAQ